MRRYPVVKHVPFGSEEKEARRMADLDYGWRLREVMAERGMFSTTELRPLLAARGVELSASQVYRLVVDKPERLNLRTLMALLDILDCAMDDLIKPPSTRAPRRPE
ncbi:helix-turn-helix domain-containing protein [Actinomadura geliboluensis]|uniref:helix-turn-helix domain-containing protein n=2 Tax=Actinomadura geliboluensis TaxID=882440 RepID=UPI0036890540